MQSGAGGLLQACVVPPGLAAGGVGSRRGLQELGRVRRLASGRSTVKTGGAVLVTSDKIFYFNLSPSFH